MGFVSQILIPKYGWGHKEAGKKYPKTEMSFRQTINGTKPTDRGFMIKVDRKEEKIIVSFDASEVSKRHKKWLQSVDKKVGLEELNPQPYWGFNDLEHKAGTKLLNCFYVQAEVKKEKDREFYKYSKVMMLRKFNFDGFLKAIENATLLVDFDARSGHNHGTKFRLKQNKLPLLYQNIKVII